MIRNPFGTVTRPASMQRLEQHKPASASKNKSHRFIALKGCWKIKRKNALDLSRAQKVCQRMSDRKRLSKQRQLRRVDRQLVSLQARHRFQDLRFHNRSPTRWLNNLVFIKRQCSLKRHRRLTTCWRRRHLRCVQLCRCNQRTWYWSNNRL